MKRFNKKLAKQTRKALKRIRKNGFRDIRTHAVQYNGSRY